MGENSSRKIIIEAQSGERFEAEIDCGTELSQVAAQFFEAQDIPLNSNRRKQRAVIEIVNPHNPAETKRLNPESDICTELADEDTIRIFTESIAGAAIDPRAREMALVADSHDMRRLKERDPRIDYKTNRAQAPDVYELTFKLESFIEYLPGQMQSPQIGTVHKAKIVLGSLYPRKAPIVEWQTPIFHPNIHKESSQVCLGVLMDRYQPGLGLARIVGLLIEMLEWRNFDIDNAYNKEAAEWANLRASGKHIINLGGYLLQDPVFVFINRLKEGAAPKIEFKPL